MAKLITVDTPFGPVQAYYSRAKALTEYYQNPNHCQYCDNIIEIKAGRRIYDEKLKQFCSRSCAVSFYNSKKPKRLAKIKFCKYCGNQMKGSNFYCSIECHNKAMELKDNAKDKYIEENYNNCADKTLKKYLIKHRGHRCEKCGITTWLDQPAPIELHHMDGNSRDNRLDNLQLLCCNCHSLEPTSKGGNLGNGRRYRYLNKYKGYSSQK